MRRATRPLRNALFALGIAGALGFGAQQAFARDTLSGTASCSTNRDCWHPAQCAAGGVCSNGTCVCY
jgi:hypothetical protein